ncbi:MAG: flagellar basal body rod protein FlgC [Opitutaceae bacterium]
MNLLSGIDITAGALNAQKTRLDLVAQNIANAQTTRTPKGGAYQRQIVSFESELIRREGAPAVGAGGALQGVKIASITSDRTPGQQVYNPQHPDAGADGLVTMPNVNLSYEMVDLITASRAYEANLAVAKNARQMAMKALEIGK